MTNKDIDKGKPFDWGKASSDYAKYRDIYPEVFYKKIADRGLCVAGQNVLDVGTGTGVVPRNMIKYGANWTGIDISAQQIEQAKMLSQGSGIEYFSTSVEDMNFTEKAFDVVTACQCFFYFDHNKTSNIFSKILKDNGKLLILYMAWLPYEDYIAGESEKLILKFNPDWSGAGETMKPIFIPEIYKEKFSITHREEYYLPVNFTRETWHGRMKACRGVGASMGAEEIKEWEAEHIALLENIAPPKFDVLHYAAMAELQKNQA